MGEEPPPEEPARQEVVFRAGEDGAEGAAEATQPRDEADPAQAAQAAVDAAFDADVAFEADPGADDGAYQSDPHAFAAAVAEAEARAETTGEFAGPEDDAGVGDEGFAEVASSEAEANEEVPAAAPATTGADTAPDDAVKAGPGQQADEVADFYGDLIAQDAAEQDNVPEATAPPPAARKLPKRRKGFRTGLAAGWAFLLLAAGAIAIVAITQRVEIVRLMPGSAPLYEAVGLPVNIRGLDFRDVAYSWETDAGQVVLEVHGDIVNLTSKPLEVPSLVLGLRDATNAEVYQWEEAVMTAPLGAGDSATFAVRIPTPPKSIKSVQVRFARAR